MYFFAYDDKMCSKVFAAILPHCECLGQGAVKGYRLYFHRHDDSMVGGLANIVKVDDVDETTYGVLYRIQARDKYLLDQAQKLGFGSQETTLNVIDPQGNAVIAFSFVANQANVLQDLVPFSWYKALLVQGAKEHHLPKTYIQHLQAYASQPDSNPQRAEHYSQFVGS